MPRSTKLKPAINATRLIKQAKERAAFHFDECYQPEVRKEAFLDGVKWTIKQMREHENRRTLPKEKRR